MPAGDPMVVGPKVKGVVLIVLRLCAAIGDIPAPQGSLAGTLVWTQRDDHDQPAPPSSQAAGGPRGKVQIS
jgi:hypothetical protein